MYTISRNFIKANNDFYAERYADKVRVELLDRDDLSELLGDRKESFIKWAGRSRLNYESDLDEEVNDFLNPIPKEGIRLYNSNLKEWRRICKEVFERDNYTCAYCGNMGGKLECDHIHPFSKGGTNDLTNLTTACQRCNRQKRDKTIEEFNHWKELKLKKEV